MQKLYSLLTPTTNTNAPKTLWETYLNWFDNKVITGASLNSSPPNDDNEQMNEGFPRRHHTTKTASFSSPPPNATEPQGLKSPQLQQQLESDIILYQASHPFLNSTSGSYCLGYLVGDKECEILSAIIVVQHKQTGKVSIVNTAEFKSIALPSLSQISLPPSPHPPRFDESHSTLPLKFTTNNSLPPPPSLSLDVETQNSITMGNTFEEEPLAQPLSPPLLQAPDFVSNIVNI